MPKASKPHRPIPPIEATEAHAMVAHLYRRIADFKGDLNELESAIGMYFAGQLLGWKVLLLIHNKRTIRKYEEILGIEVRTEFPEEGPFVDKSVALNVVKKIGSFWKAVSGEVKDEELRERRKELES